ncbi:MAG: hypothetical protein IJU96_08880 [Clostridia bacterium]|nr:hypothetical protein [Clostridia bacterium]
MKRLCALILTAFLLFLLPCLSAAAVTESPDYRDQLRSSGAADLTDALSREDRENLKELGIDAVDFDALFNISPRRVFDLFFDVLQREYHSPLKASLTAATVLLLLAVTQAFTDGKPLGKSVMQLGCIILALVIAVPMTACLVRMASAVQAQSKMMLALIPVLAVVITVSGNPTLALSYNTLTFAMAQGVVQLVQNAVRPLIQIVFSLSLVSALSDALGVGKLIEFFKKAGIFLMSLAATVFVTMLVLKCSLASSADTVAVRGIRFLIGRAVPVLGSALSDAYLSVIGSLNLVKNTAAVFADICILVIALPVITEGLLWSFAVNLLAAAADLFGLSKASGLLKAMSGGLTLLNVTLVLTSVVMVLSVGLILLIKNT